MHLLVGAVKSASGVSEQAWRTLDSWCENIPIIFALQTSTKPTAVPIRNCIYVHVGMDDSIIRTLRDRLLRISEARQQQRELLNAAVTDFESVIMVDMDVKLPSYQVVERAIGKLKYYHIICGNGFEYNPWHQRQVYDTFPLVLHNGLWMYKHLGKKQQTLFKTILKSRDVFPVRYCFGGMALYRPSVWNAPKCGFRGSATDFQTTRKKSCEHLRFQQCLRKGYNFSSVGIDPELLVERTWDPKPA